MTDLQAQIAKSLGRKKSQPVPLLGYSYQGAVNTICGAPVQIAQKFYAPLKAMMTKLDELVVAYDTFSYTVVQSYWPWCRDQLHMRIVPLKIFCGKAAWDKFAELNESTVKLPTPNEAEWSDMVHKELNAARMYIGAQVNRTLKKGKIVTLTDAREMAHQLNPPEAVVIEAEKLLQMAYGVEGSYNTIITTLMDRRK
jgi:hypothetical protein